MAFYNLHVGGGLCVLNYKGKRAYIPEHERISLMRAPILFFISVCQMLISRLRISYLPKK